MTPPPAEIIAALDARSARFTTPCGSGTMAWRRWGEGRPVVLLHGGSGSWKHWVRNIDVLRQRQQVWAADMPGFGESAEPADPPDFETMAAPITAGLRTLLPGETPFDLVGFSLGSHVSQPVARELGARIRRLVLVNGHLVGEFVQSPQQMLERWRDAKSEAERLAIYRRNVETLMFADPANVDALAMHIYVSDMACARTRPGKFLHLRDQTLIRRLTCPIAAIAGALDPLGRPTPKAQTERLLEMQPAAQIRIIAGAGHWVAYEAADAFNHALEQVLA